MGTFGGASLENSYPPNGWIVAADVPNDKPFSSFSPSPVLPVGGSRLIQKNHSDWSSRKHPLKQEPVSAPYKLGAPISIHQPPDVRANVPTVPVFGQINDWRRAGTDPFAFGSNSETKVSGKFDLSSYASNRSLPVIFCNSMGSMDIPKMTPKEIMDAKALAASKSHSEAERRRRQRINTHMATLRTLVPSTTKTDKASLLAEVVHHLRELKQQATKIAQISPVPTEIDELHVDFDSASSEDKLLLKASLCCDDRDGLLSDIAKALRDLKLQIVKAEIVTVGGRVKNVMLMTRADHLSCKQEGPSLTSVQEALKTAMEKSPSDELSPSNFLSYKRHRTTYHCF